MMLIPCPWCGPRNDAEFTPGGEAHITRPALTVNDQQWGEYLYFRKNIKACSSSAGFMRTAAGAGSTSRATA